MPKISVLLLAYNVEKYIEQAIESILVQKTNFDMEILVGNDGSTDKTVNILRKYEAKYPETIKLHITSKNKGNALDFINLKAASKGKYFTVLDGDDYWIDEKKLQKQIDFLEKNPEFYVCGHNTHLMKNEKIVGKIYDSAIDKTPYKFQTNDFKELLLGGNVPYMHTSSLIYKNDFMKDIEYSKWATPYYRGDTIRTFFYGEKGKIKYLNEIMSVYRLHTDGIYTRLSDVEKEIRHIEFYEYHKNNTFSGEYKTMFNQVILNQFSATKKICKGIFFLQLKYFFLKYSLEISIYKKNIVRKMLSYCIQLGFKFLSLFIKGPIEKELKNNYNRGKND